MACMHASCAFHAGMVCSAHNGVCVTSKFIFISGLPDAIQFLFNNMNPLDCIVTQMNIYSLDGRALPALSGRVSVARASGFFALASFHFMVRPRSATAPHSRTLACPRDVCVSHGISSSLPAV